MKRYVDKRNISIKIDNGKDEDHKKRNLMNHSLNSEFKEKQQNTVMLSSCTERAKNGKLNHETEINRKSLELSKYKKTSEALPASLQHVDTQLNSSSKVLESEWTENGPLTEKIMSEGEASSSFETISSVESILNVDDLSLSSDYEHRYSTKKQVENDSFRKKWNSNESNFFGNDRNIISSKNQSKSYLGRYIYERYESCRNYKQTKYLERYDRYNERVRWAGENDSCYESIEKVTHYHERSRKSDRRRRSRSRCSDNIRKSIESKGGHRSRKLSSSGYVHRSRSHHNRSSKRNYEFSRSRSPNHKMRRLESRRSRSSDKLNSSLYRKSSRKREKSFSISPSASVSQQLNNDRISDRVKIDLTKDSPSPSFSSENKKKERTPFLVELEKRPKEVEGQKNTIKKLNLPENEKKAICISNSIATSTPEPVKCQKPNAELPSNCVLSMQPVPGVHSLQPTSMPTVSVDNLPLVPGQMGLPIHITASGEIIPHDMDGRRIPIDPNGYYLPLDPTGRLFAHIVSPGNQAVPIHRTEDGILRLPNSEPVPYGPSHRFPVNIDGTVIVIGPDSRPLVPCANLPTQPPLNVLQMTQFNAACSSKTEKQQMISNMPQTSETVDAVNSLKKVSQAENFYLPKLQPPVVDSNLLGVIQNCNIKTNKANLYLEYKKTVCEKNEDISKVKEIKKNLEVNPSSGRDKRLIPLQPSQEKTSKNECFSDTNMILDSNDSDSPSGSKSLSEMNNGCSPRSSKVSSSVDVENIMKITFGNEIFKESAFESKEKDPIVKKIQQALKSLSGSNFKPPAPGRFIFSEFITHPTKDIPPNASPLLRNRVKLSFLTPNSVNFQVREKSKSVEKNNDLFRFLSEEKSAEKEEKSFRLKKTFNNTSKECKLPVLTVDFAMQCDLTSVVTQKLTSKVSEMEMEVVRLREVNTNLIKEFKNFQQANEKKDEKLGKALLEIEKRNNEILTLKRLISEKETKKLLV